jgi:HAD superfamily hydrolase (TIGR01549 family)
MLRALLFDLGDTIMQEETEIKNEDGITQSAELFDGMAELLRFWHSQNVPLVLVADAYVETCRNVLTQHKLYDLFSSFAISEEVGVSKPDSRMFRKALDALGINEQERADVIMVGNNLSRDIRGANALGLRSVWIHRNERYPIEPADEWEKPMHVVHSSTELQMLLEQHHASQLNTISILKGKVQAI